MNGTVRHVLFGLFGSALLGLLVWGVTGLEPFGHYPGPYGDILNRVAPEERHVQNVVTAVIFDYRGFDTLGEEFILFGSVTGVLLLLRRSSDETGKQGPTSNGRSHPQKLDPQASDLVRLFSFPFIGGVLVFGIYIILTGHLSLGGGFQGGVIISGAWLLMLLAYGSDVFRRLSKQYVLEWFEATGAGGYAIVGCFGLIMGKPFLANVLPLGHLGHLLSSGTILLINCAVGIEVAAGFALLLAEFVRPLETEVPLREP